LTMGFLGFGAAAFGRRFRLYSIATIVAVLLFGLLTAPLAARLAANQSTPWLGVYERVCIYAYQLWLTVLAARLLGSAARGAARVPVTMAGTRRTGRDVGSSRPASPHPG
jgi:ABC-type transport system involved in cytochrome c biogenesis permease subunit